MRRFFSCLRFFFFSDDSVITPATEHRFVNGFFLVRLWDFVTWLWSSHKITSCRQVARRGGAGGMWRWKGTEKRGGMTKCHVLRTRIADSHRGPSFRPLEGAHAAPSFRPLEGAHAAPSQLLVHRMISSGQRVPRFRCRQTTEPGIGSSINITFFSRRGTR